MAQLAGNNLGINYNFDLGSGGWKDPMDNNLFLSDAFLQPFIEGVASAPPGSPARGDMVIIGPGASGAFTGQENNIAIYNEITSSWDILIPRTGWKLYDQTSKVTWLYQDAKWILDTSSFNVIDDSSTTGRTLAITDSGAWIRMSGNDVDPLALTIPGNASTAFVVGTCIHITQTTNSNVTITPAAGVTLNGDSLTSSKNGVFIIVKVGLDEWDVVHIPRQGWLTGSTPLFSGVVAPSTNTSTLRYKVDGKKVTWKIDMIYTGLNTTDADPISITGLPLTMSGRTGGIQMEIQGSTGMVLLATDTIHASYDQVSDAINFVDNSGTQSTYDGGKIQAAGTIHLSGWYEAA